MTLLLMDEILHACGLELPKNMGATCLLLFLLLDGCSFSLVFVQPQTHCGCK